MADFRSWSQENLANLAAEQQAEIIRLNNQDCARLKLLRDLCAEFDLLSDMFCKVPVRNEAYRAAMEALK